MDNPDLSNKKNYLKFIEESFPEYEDYVQIFLDIGLTHIKTHQCIKKINKKGVSRYNTPKHTVAMKLSELFFDETMTINNDFVAKYHGDGSYYDHDTGSLTKHMESMDFSDFLMDYGFTDENVKRIINKYKLDNLQRTEYIICLLHYVTSTMFPGTLPPLDTKNIIRWGRKYLRRYAKIDSYMLNFNTLRNFILTENDINFVYNMLNMLVDEFPHSNTVNILLSLADTGTIIKKSSYSNLYNDLDCSPLEKCKKFINNNNQ
jgi:hypothetical protein